MASLFPFQYSLFLPFLLLGACKGEEVAHHPTTSVTIPVRMDTSNGGLSGYITTIGFGTPRRELSLEIDTGSALNWIHCFPCLVGCSPRQERLFNPSESATYSNVSCTSPQCRSSRPCSSENVTTCNFRQIYGDKSSVEVVLATDTLRLTATDVLPNILFGCSHNNTDMGKKTAGLLAIGRGRLSTISQAFGIFSYCLPSNPTSEGYLKFGPPSQKPKKFTRMLSYPNAPQLYYIDIVAIRVNGQDITLRSSSSTTKAFLDSGSTISRLPTSSFAALKAAIQKAMAAYPPTSPVIDSLNTCFDISGHPNFTIPSLSFVLSDGVTFDVDPSGVFIMDKAGTSPCLAFMPTEEDMIIVGSFQQKKIDILHDVANEVIGFTPSSCP